MSTTPQPERSNGAAYAKALLAELGGQATDVSQIAGALGLTVREVEAEGFDGALVRANGIPLGAIVLRKSLRETGRKNFTIAHEIGHFVLAGHEQESLACASSDVADWSESSGERERDADGFAAELLMPASLVRPLVNSLAPSLQTIEEIARKFRTSLSAAAWRYCDLVSEPCAVVWSTDGVAQWSKRSATFSSALAKGKRIEEGSFADACFRKAKVPGRPRTVPVGLWLSATDLNSTRQIWEQSKALPAYRSVISLLWFKAQD